LNCGRNMNMPAVYSLRVVVQCRRYIGFYSAAKHASKPVIDYFNSFMRKSGYAFTVLQ